MTRMSQTMWNTMTNREKLEHLYKGKVELVKQIGLNPHAKVNSPASDHVITQYSVVMNGVTLGVGTDIVNVLRVTADFIEELGE
ncbi:MAG: hypothetical protein ACRC8W_11225 [Plesiomonas shigelloides]